MRTPPTSDPILGGDALAQLSLGELLELRGALDMVLTAPVSKALDPLQVTAQVERRLARDYIKAWRAAAAKALSDVYREVIATAGRLSPARIGRFVERMGLRLKKPLTERQQKIIDGRIRKAYQVSKRATQGGLKIKPSFSLRDQKAIGWIAKEQVLWINDFYSSELSGRVRGVVNDIVLSQGMSNRQAGRELRKAVEREFGLRSGGPSRFAPQVPARYSGEAGVNLYYRQLASVASQRARVWSKVAAYSEGGVITYRLTNPNDQRTGLICQQMSGQVFSVATAVEHVGRMMQAETVDEVKAVQPWVQGNQLAEALKGTEKGSPEATKALQEVGAILPPFHPLCRTEPVILSFKKPALAAPAPAVPRPPVGKPKAAAPAPLNLPARGRLPQPIPKGTTEAQLGNMTAAEVEHMWGGWTLERLPLATYGDVDAVTKALATAEDELARVHKAIGKSGRTAAERAKVRGLIDELENKISNERRALKEIAQDIGPLTSEGKAALGSWAKPLLADMRGHFPNQVAVSLANRRYKMRQVAKSGLWSKGKRGVVGEHTGGGANEIRIMKGLKAHPSESLPSTASRANVAIHEAGHAIDTEVTQLGMSDLFFELPYEKVSRYAEINTAENVAESIALTLVDTNLKAKVAANAPIRHRIASRMFRTDESYRRGLAIFAKFRAKKLSFEDTLEALETL